MKDPKSLFLLQIVTSLLIFQMHIHFFFRVMKFELYRRRFKGNLRNRPSENIFQSSTEYLPHCPHRLRYSLQTVQWNTLFKFAYDALLFGLGHAEFLAGALYNTNSKCFLSGVNTVQVQREHKLSKRSQKCSYLTKTKGQNTFEKRFKSVSLSINEVIPKMTDRNATVDTAVEW